MPKHYAYNADRFSRKYVIQIGGVMRYVIYGAGAIGGVIGGKLFQAGHEVVLIARGAHYDAVAARGLRLETPDKPLLEGYVEAFGVDPHSDAGPPAATRCAPAAR
jgi:hypothetical protein